MTTQIAMPQSGTLPKVKGPEMNDRDFINDILAMEKYLSMAYGIGLNEMQNPELHRDVQAVLNDVHEAQFQCFETMFGQGWYKMKAADQAEVGQTHKQFDNYRTQFPDFS